MAKKVKKYAKAGYVDYAGSNQDLSRGMSNYTSMGNAGGATGFSVAPTFRMGMPGFRLRSSFKEGGSVSKRADGCAQRGKTKGKMV